MSKQATVLTSLLLAAIGVPYALLDGGLNLAKFNWSSLVSGSAPQASAPPNFAPGGPPFSLTGGVENPDPLAPRLEGMPVNDFAEIFRFDVTPKWVLSRWARVSTLPTELEFEGYRVPLVTGGRPDDIAGSLTYYFNKKHEAQRISFEGVTGDERRLVGLLTSQFQMQPQPSLNAGLFLAKKGGKTHSGLRVSVAPVVRAEASHSRFELILELNRPGTKHGLSQQFSSLLVDDHESKRW